MAPPACEKEASPPSSPLPARVVDNSSFWRYVVTVRVPRVLSVEDYARDAGLLLNMLQTVFASEAKIATLTKNTALQSCHCDTHISYEDDELVAQCLLEMRAEKRVLLDKPKLRTVLAAESPFDVPLKVEKRAATTGD